MPLVEIQRPYYHSFKYINLIQVCFYFIMLYTYKISLCLNLQ